MELDVLYQVVDRGIDLAQAIVQCCCMACRCCAKLVTKSWRVSAGSGKWLAWRRVEMKIHVEIVHPVGKLSDIVGSDVCQGGSWNNGSCHVAAKLIGIHCIPVLHCET